MRQTWELGLREGQGLAQGHTGGKKQNWDLHPGLCDSKALRPDG